MSTDIREQTAHLRWIGGGTDAGKTSVARLLSTQHRWPVYHCDRADLRHHQRLAQTIPAYDEFLRATLEQRWVEPTPEALTDRTWQSFHDRFPFILEEVGALDMPDGMGMLVEGFCLTPALLAPLLTSPNQAIWLIPTKEFKLASMQRRGKGTLGGEVSDPDRRFQNLFQRDRLLAERISAEAEALNLTVINIDGSESIERVAARVAEHFGIDTPG